MNNKTNAASLRPISKEKLFSKLGQSKYFIANTDQTTGFNWGLYVRSTDKAASLSEVICGKVFQQLLSDGLVKIESTAFDDHQHNLKQNGLHSEARLTRAGRAYLKRRLTNNGEFIGQHQIKDSKIFEGAHQQEETMINLAESPLTWLATRKDKNGKKLIEDYQFVSGERLRSDYECGLMAPNITRSWDRLFMPQSHHKGATGSGISSTEAVVNARQKVAMAIKAVGPELSCILVDVCCEQRGLEEAEKRNSWPKRSGKVILSMALTCLARHYGLISNEKNAPQTYAKIMHWGAEGYRPRVES